MPSRQVKTTIRGSLLAEFDALCQHTGLCLSGVLKLSIRRLAQTELYQNQTASSAIVTKEAA